jgi:hypothetical protein
MTLGQSLVGMMFLVNMQLAWWEAAALFGLWFVQFIFSPIAPGPDPLGFISGHIHAWVTYAYLIWAGIALVRMALGKRRPLAFVLFHEVWRTRLHPQRSQKTR